MTRLHLLDKVALAVTITLSIFGVIFIHSATNGNENEGLWIKQVIWILAGLVFYFGMSRTDYKVLVSQANWLYLGGIISLVLVLFTEPINGAHSWFRLPGFSLQPSEFVKIVTVLMVTKYFSRFHERNSSFWEFVTSSLLIGIPFVLILLQSDMGTALVYLPFFLIPNFLIGKKESIYVSAGGGIVLLLVIMAVVYKPNWVFFMKDYQKDRIVSFIYPERDTANKGYQVHQSKISIGQGGLFGMGLGKGKQTQMGFLPAQHNDFILAVAAEETGFVGIFTIFGLFAWLFMRGFQTALEASDTTGSALVVLVISTLFVQMLFNAAMLIGLVPTTGIPCPLISYGGSSMLTTFGLLGLVQSVRTHRFVNQ